MQAAAGGQESFSIGPECYDDITREDLQGLVRRGGKDVPLAPIESRPKIAGYTSADPTGMSTGNNADNHGKVALEQPACCDAVLIS